MKNSKFGNKKFCKYCEKTLSYEKFRLLVHPKTGWKDFEGNHRYHRCWKCEQKWNFQAWRKLSLSKTLLKGALYRSRKNKSKWDLTEEVIDKMLRETNGKCASCKSEFERKKYLDIGHTKNLSSATLDRIDNTNRNYTKNNVRIICYKCNFIKMDWSLKDLENIVRYMKKG